MSDDELAIPEQARAQAKALVADTEAKWQVLIEEGSRRALRIRLPKGGIGLGATALAH